MELSKVRKQTLFLAKESTIEKYTFFDNKLKIEMKTNTITAINELKYSRVSEGNNCIAELNLDVLPLSRLSKVVV